MTTPIALSLALALVLVGQPASVNSSTPQVFAGAPSAEFGRTRVLIFGPDGAFASVSSLPVRRGGVGLDLRHGYQTYCGRWRGTPGGPVQVSEWLTESFSYAVPPDAGHQRTETFALSGGALSAPRARLRSGHDVYVKPDKAPFDTDRVDTFRTGCRTSGASPPPRP